jgi:hypothetical protein
MFFYDRVVPSNDWLNRRVAIQSNTMESVRPHVCTPHDSFPQYYSSIDTNRRIKIRNESIYDIVWRTKPAVGKWAASQETDARISVCTFQYHNQSIKRCHAVHEASRIFGLEGTNIA